jgi:hypothetical protein
MTSTRIFLLSALVGVLAAAAPAPDYGRTANWICRPGNEGACTRGLDAVTVTADGARTKQNFTPAAAPPIDCFYVYPTASGEATTYSDMMLTPELAAVTRDQVGRLTSRCRLFAPIYRQLTGAGLAAVLAAHGTPDWRGPYQDVAAAWRWYMAHDNGGRGVVLIGHSQGAIVLQQLLAQQIDRRPDEQVLVAAFLAGDPSLPVARHGVTGGVFKHIPVCTDGAQTGCVYVWASYLADDTSPDRMFGVKPPGKLVAACANPAAPDGGPGALKAYFVRPRSAPPSDPPWLNAEGQLCAKCEADAQGNVVRVAILPTRFAAAVRTALREGVGDDAPKWGLHALDIELMQGNILDRVAAESAAWLRHHTARSQ